MFVGQMTVSNEFEHEDPTKPEVTETLVMALERWRKEPSSKRPATRDNMPILKDPANE